MEKMKIIDMNEKHIPELAQLEKICFSQPWSEKSLSEELDNRTAHFLVAESDEKIAGYIGIFVVCESCYVSNVAVFPEYRRQGVAKQLIERACVVAEENGAESISLEVRPSNAAAVSLYGSVGFEEVGIRKNFYRAPVEDALIMTRTLTKKTENQV